MKTSMQSMIAGNADEVNESFIMLLRSDCA